MGYFFPVCLHSSNYILWMQLLQLLKRPAQMAPMRLLCIKFKGPVIGLEIWFWRNVSRWPFPLADAVHYKHSLAPQSHATQRLYRSRDFLLSAQTRGIALWARHKHRRIGIAGPIASPKRLKRRQPDLFLLLSLVSAISTLMDSFIPSEWLKFLMLLIHLTILFTR